MNNAADLSNKVLTGFVKLSVIVICNLLGLFVQLFFLYALPNGETYENLWLFIVYFSLAASFFLNYVLITSLKPGKAIWFAYLPLLHVLYFALLAIALPFQVNEDDKGFGVFLFIGVPIYWGTFIVSTIVAHIKLYRGQKRHQ